MATSNAVGSSSGKDMLDAALVDRLRKEIVYDSDGKEHAFEELIHAKDGEKCLVIFIRHFHCGMCQGYLKELTEVAPPQHFERANVRVSVVGHGEASVMKGYAETLNLPWTIYSQPSKALHKALGMTQTLDLGPKPETQKTSFMGNLVGSISNAFKIGGLTSGGEIKQNGGELIFEPGYHCSYVHTMRNTRDHTPISELLSKLGVKGA